MGILKGFRRLVVSLMSRIDSFMNLSPLKTTVSRKVFSFSDISAVNFILVRKSMQRQAARTPNVVFLVALHYQSLQIVVLLLQVCLFGNMALSRTLLLQELQWLQQDRRFRLYTRVTSAVVSVLQVA